MRSPICWALFRLKKGFFGGSPGSCTLRRTRKSDTKNKKTVNSHNQHSWILNWFSLSSKDLLTWAVNWPAASAGATQTHWTSSWRWRSSWWSTRCRSNHRSDHSCYSGDNRNLALVFCFYLHEGRFHSLCMRARSRSSVCAGPAPRRWLPAAWMEGSGVGLEVSAMLSRRRKLYWQIEEVLRYIKKERGFEKSPKHHHGPESPSSNKTR